MKINEHTDVNKTNKNDLVHETFGSFTTIPYNSDG